MIEQIPIHAFQEELQKKSAAQRIPFEASLEVTYGCNLRCVHCYNPTHQALPNELSTSGLFKILDDLAALGCMIVTVSGGEAFTRPDIWDILHYAKQIGLQINLFTNATLLDQTKIEKIQALEPNLVSISIYGMTEKTYETVTQVPGSFKKFMTAFELLKNSKLPLLFKMPAMTLNRHELGLAHQWFKQQRLRFIHSAEIHPRVDGDTQPLAYRLSPEEAALLRLSHEESPSCRTAANPLESKTEVFTCSCGKKSFAITPYGEMNLCVTTYHPRYQIQTGSMKEGWKLLVDFVESFKPSERFECPQCEFSDDCSQGPMDAFLNTGDFNPCVPYFKETARRVKSLINNNEN